MATSIEAIIDNLKSFYNFDGKHVIHVGAGGGQLIGYADAAGSVFCVDNDREAIDQLKTALSETNMGGKFTVHHGDFLSVSRKADVVFFELCLHEMDQPKQALVHGCSLAPEVLILDHTPESEWAWHTCEEEKAKRGWQAVAAVPVVSKKTFRGVQHFNNHQELVGRVEIMGETAVERAKKFEGRTNIEIEMLYATALASKVAPGG